MRTPLLIGVLLAWLPCAALAEALVVYSGRGEALVGPILERFEQQSGLELDVRYNATPALATQLLNEAAESPADLIFLQDSGYLGALAQAGLLAELATNLVEPVDERFRDPQRRWVGTSGRARVLVYNTGELAATELPASLDALADPRWKGRIGWAPANASFQAHVSALRHLWGEAETRAWLEKMKANQPVVYPKNSPQVQAAASGEIALGWVNHYYLHRLKRPGFAAANYSFPTPGDAGNVLMVAGVAVRAGSTRTEQAELLIAHLLSEPVQAAFASEGFEYPTRIGVATHPDVPPLAELRLAAVDQSHLTDLGPTLELLRDLGLQ